MVDVPTTDDATDTAMSGLKTGGAAGLGQTIGRSILGPGIGTAAGGVLAGSMFGGSERDMIAALGVERGVNELMAGGGGGGSSRGRM